MISDTDLLNSVKIKEPQHLSIRRAKSIYALPTAKQVLSSSPVVSPIKVVDKDPPAFFLQSVSEELIEARSPASSRRNSGVSSRRSSYGVTQTAHLLFKDPESAVVNAKKDVRLAKKKLSKFASIQYSPNECAHRGLRGIEDACRALLAVEDLYHKEDALDEAMHSFEKSIIDARKK